MGVDTLPLNSDRARQLEVGSASASFYLLVGLLVVCLLGGGSSFIDTQSLLYVRPFAVLALFLFLGLPGALNLRLVKVPLALLAGWIGLILLQLIPLPPGLWASLPGHMSYVEVADAMGFPQPWRPLSLTPDLTLNALANTLIPLAVLVGFAKLSAPERGAFVPVIIGMFCASVALGIVQIAMGASSIAYLYSHTNPGLPVGFLANRNHHAVMLGAGFPLLLTWLKRDRKGGHEGGKLRLGVALLLGLLFALTILTTGSRAGAAALLLSLAMTGFLAIRDRRRDQRGRVSRWITGAVLLVAIGLLAVVSFQLGRALSIDRLISPQGQLQKDLRFSYFPQTIAIGNRFFPFGSGIGSFEPVFINFEPDEMLSDQYANQAHNDLLDIYMTAGVPGLLILAPFIAWVVISGLSLLRRGRDEPTPRLAQLGLVIILLLLLASLVDYPLRTPLLSALFAVCCGWLCTGQRLPQPRQAHAIEGGSLIRL